MRRLRELGLPAQGVVLVFVLALAGTVLAQDQAGQVQEESFAIEVALPRDEPPERFIANATQKWGLLILGTTEVSSWRNSVTTILIGPFETAAVALHYAKQMVARGIIKAFAIKSVSEVEGLNRLRTITNTAARTSGSGNSPSDLRDTSADNLPQYDRTGFQAAVVVFNLTPSADTLLIPRPDPVRLALADIAGSKPSQEGGLWLSGDIAEGLARLRWAVGNQLAGLVTVDKAGRVTLDRALLAKAAGVTDANQVGARLIIADFILSREGLLLLAQVTEGPYLYLLHIGHRAPTLMGEVTFSSALNLDKNFDSRINPRRPGGKKFKNELPPSGFDSLVAINLAARYYNLTCNCPVPQGAYTFHELAEAHAKVALGLEYMPVGDKPGAHDVAIERELRLKWQQPLLGVVVTQGLNQMIKSEEEWRRFIEDQARGKMGKAMVTAGGSHRR